MERSLVQVINAQNTRIMDIEIKDCANGLATKKIEAADLIGRPRSWSFIAGIKASTTYGCF